MKRIIVFILFCAVLIVPLMAQDGGGLDTGGILSIVFGLLMTVFGGVAAWLKRKSTKLANFSRESMQAALAANNLVQHHNDAIADEKLTKEELAGYVEKAKAVGKETGEAVQAFKDLFKKNPSYVVKA